MNIHEMDIKTLMIIWETSHRNLFLKNQIEIELQKRIPNNNIFYREYFFNICKIKDHAITVFFLPTSNAFKNYGKNISIDVIYSDEEINELVRNYRSEPSIKTFGMIRAKILKKII